MAATGLAGGPIAVADRRQDPAPGQRVAGCATTPALRAARPGPAARRASTARDGGRAAAARRAPAARSARRCSTSGSSPGSATRSASRRLFRGPGQPVAPGRGPRGAELELVVAENERVMKVSVAKGRRPRSIYRANPRGRCPRCGGPVSSRGQGDDNRTAYWCPALSGVATPDREPRPGRARHSRSARLKRDTGADGRGNRRAAHARAAVRGALGLRARADRCRGDPALVPEGRARLPRGRPLRRLLHRPQRRPAGDPRALRRPRDRARDARSGRHLRRARDARRRQPLGERRDAHRCRAARAAGVGRAPGDRRARRHRGEADRRDHPAAAGDERARRPPVVPDRAEPRRRACSRS